MFPTELTLLSFSTGLKKEIVILEIGWYKDIFYESKLTLALPVFFFVFLLNPNLVEQLNHTIYSEWMPLTNNVFRRFQKKEKKRNDDLLKRLCCWKSYSFYIFESFPKCFTTKELNFISIGSVQQNGLIFKFSTIHIHKCLEW